MDIAMKHAAALSLLAFAAACATGPKPCTAEWVDWKTARFFDEFVRDHRNDITEIRDITSRLSGTDDRSAGNIATMALAGIRVLAMAGDFLQDTVPEVQDALAQCGTAPRASQLFASLLRREGFDERAVKAIEDLGAFIGKET
jgi:hypothetical protein